jgi:hypothetical protein
MGIEMDYATKADIGAAVFDATNRAKGKADSPVDNSVEQRFLIGERVARRLGDYGLKIVRDNE